MEQKFMLKEYHTSLTAILLAILPILAPYSLFNTSVLLGDFLILLFCGYIVAFKTKKIYINFPLLLYIGVISINSLISFLFTHNLDFQKMIMSLVKNILYFVCFSILWGDLKEKKEIFYKAVLIVSLISCLFIFYQFTCELLNLEIPSGKIWGLIIDKDKTFSPIHTYQGLRLHSFFQEPSYLAIYTLAALSLSLRYNKYVVLLIQVAALVICTSSLGYIGLIIVFLYYMLISGQKKKISVCLKIILVFIVVNFILINGVPEYKEFLDLSMEKVLNISDDLQSEEYTSANMRILGYLYFFPKLPLLNKFIGLGQSQFTTYFIEYHLYNYSNAYVINLLNHGIVGLTVFLLALLQIYKKINKEDRIFIIIFLLVCVADAFLFNMYFFFVLTFVVIVYPQNVAIKIRS